MAHIIIIIDAIESLESESAHPPTEAQANLKAALEAADEWAHDHEEQTEVIAQIESDAAAVKSYCDAPGQPQDVRLQSWADHLNGLID